MKEFGNAGGPFGEVLSFFPTLSFIDRTHTHSSGLQGKPRLVHSLFAGNAVVGKMDLQRWEKGKLLRIGFWSTSLLM